MIALKSQETETKKWKNFAGSMGYRLELVPA